MFPETMTLPLFRAWVYNAILEQLEEVRDRVKGKYLAALISELKRREAY